VTLVNGKDQASFGNLAWPTAFFGPDLKQCGAGK
jgi:hypothetical protein